MHTLLTLNIVGYQNQGYSHSKYSIAAATFVPVGAKRSEMTIGDISVNSDFVYSSIRFVTDTGASARTDFKGKTVPATYIYWTKDDDPADGEGWYLEADEDTEINQNALPLPFGTGYMVFRQSDEADAQLTYSGEVQKTPMTRDFPTSKYSICGNCSPVKINLGDITVNSDFVYSSIRFVTDTGASARTDFKGKTVPATYIYWTKDDDPADGAGWYLEADEDTEINQNELVKFEPGEGFMVFRQADEPDAELTIPAPIEE